MPTDFRELIHAVGSDFTLCQGFGGNCSIKFAEEMYVKASGKRMGSFDDADFFHRVRLTGAGSFVDDIENQGTRASIEVAMHAIMPSKYVVHLHSTHAILALSNRSNHLDWTSQKHGIEIVEYARPGAALAKATSRAVSKGATRALLLRNHGLVLASDSVEEIYETLIFLESKFGRKRSHEGRLDKIVGCLIGHEDSLLEKVVWHARNNWRITPDHVVFMGVEPGKEFRSVSSVKRLLWNIHEKLSENLLLDAIEEQAVWFVLFAMKAPKRYLSTLTIQESVSLTHWEAEKYRVQLAGTDSVSHA